MSSKGKETGFKNIRNKTKQSSMPSHTDRQDGPAENERRKLMLAVAATIIILLIAMASLLLIRPTNTLSSCGSRAIPGLKYSCYEYFANQTRNASICNNLPVPLIGFADLSSLFFAAAFSLISITQLP